MISDTKQRPSEKRPLDTKLSKRTLKLLFSNHLEFLTLLKYYH